MGAAQENDGGPALGPLGEARGWPQRPGQVSGAAVERPRGRARTSATAVAAGAPVVWRGTSGGGQRRTHRGACEATPRGEGWHTAPCTPERRNSACASELPPNKPGRAAFPRDFWLVNRNFRAKIRDSRPVPQRAWGAASLRPPPHAAQTLPSSSTRPPSPAGRFAPTPRRAWARHGSGLARRNPRGTQPYETVGMPLCRSMALDASWDYRQTNGGGVGGRADTLWTAEVWGGGTPETTQQLDARSKLPLEVCCVGPPGAGVGGRHKGRVSTAVRGGGRGLLLLLLLRIPFQSGPGGGGKTPAKHVHKVSDGQR